MALNVQIKQSQAILTTSKTIIKGIPALNDAAIKAVEKSRWKPAQQRDMKVGVYITVPINFELK